MATLLVYCCSSRCNILWSVSQPASQQKFSSLSRTLTLACRRPHRRVPSQSAPALDCNLIIQFRNTHPVSLWPAPMPLLPQSLSVRQLSIGALSALYFLDLSTEISTARGCFLILLAVFSLSATNSHVTVDQRSVRADIGHIAQIPMRMNSREYLSILRHAAFFWVRSERAFATG